MQPNRSVRGAGSDPGIPGQCEAGCQGSGLQVLGLQGMLLVYKGICSSICANEDEVRRNQGPPGDTTKAYIATDTGEGRKEANE